MTRLRAAYALALAFAGATTACGPGDGNRDGGGDVVTMDVPGADAAEGGLTDGPMADAGTCNMLPIENLNALGTEMGGVLRFTGSNAMAPNSTTAGIQVPSRLQSICAYRSVHQRVFAYTARTNAVLRISTTNMGTDRGFDTTLTVVTGACGTTRQMVIGCNDDDPAFSGDERRVSSSLVTLPVMAGTTVYIGLGGFVGLDNMRGNMEGETGTFELSVQELAPVPDGMPCDTRGLTNVCNANSTCVPNTFPSETGTCRANGTAPGAACAAGGMCSGTGLTCVGMSATNPGVCVVANVPDGMACDPYHQCGTNSTCVTLQRGGTSGVCRAHGTAAGAQCRAMAPQCDTGLTCQVGAGGGAGVCLRAAPAAGMCSTYDSACPAGQDCVGQGNAGTPGMCALLGSTAGAECTAGMCTGTGLTCTRRGTTSFCTRTVPTGMECGIFDECADGGTCYLTDPNNRYRGRCFAPGTRGGPCRTSGTACDTGLACSNTTDPSMGRCIAMAMPGGMCDFITQCPADQTCVRQGGGTTFTGVCRARGALGAPCRRTGMPCDSGLTCSSAFTSDGICQQAAMAGAACDARSSTNQCPSGQVCRATGLDTGTCAAPVMETEPNTSGLMAQMVTAPVAIRGSLSTFDSDCYAFDVPANGRVFARASTPNGLCPADLALDLYRIEGMELRLLGGDTDSGVYGCPRIDGNDPFNNFGWARDLAAGRYAVCLRNNAENRPPVQAYVLSLNVSTM